MSSVSVSVSVSVSSSSVSLYHNVCMSIAHCYFDSFFVNFNFFGSDGAAFLPSSEADTTMPESATTSAAPPTMHAANADGKAYAYDVADEPPLPSPDGCVSRDSSNPTMMGATLRDTDVKLAMPPMSVPASSGGTHSASIAMVVTRSSALEANCGNIAARNAPRPKRYGHATAAAAHTYAPACTAAPSSSTTQSTPAPSSPRLATIIRRDHASAGPTRLEQLAPSRPW